MDDWLTKKFEENRPHLRAVAYRMLGSLAEAEDAVQEAWLRLNRSDVQEIGNLNGWLATVVGRICLDNLRARKSRGEGLLEEGGFPDVILSRGEGSDPERETILADSVGLALLIVLESLAPQERLAFVLHDTFGMPFGEIASVVGCSEVAARQLASRARRKVRDSAMMPDVDLKQQRKVVDAFVAAARGGDFDSLIAVLDPDVLLRSDQVPGKVTKVHGAREVAQRAVLFSRMPGRVLPVVLNGTAGLASWSPDGKPFSVMGFVVRNNRIVEIDVIRDAERLRRVDFSAVLGNEPRNLKSVGK